MIRINGCCGSFYLFKIYWSSWCALILEWFIVSVVHIQTYVCGHHMPHSSVTSTLTTQIIVKSGKSNICDSNKCLRLLCVRVSLSYFLLLNRIEWNNKQNNWIYGFLMCGLYHNWCCVHIHNHRQHHHSIVLFSFVCSGQTHGRPVNALMCEKRVRYSVAIWPSTDCTSRFLMLAVRIWVDEKILHI